MKLRELIGADDRIGLAVLPFVGIGLVQNFWFPGVFDVGGPTEWLGILSIVVLAFGVIVWAWSVVLILARVPRGELITTGPFAIVRHPLYTSVALLVLPWLGFLSNSWLSAALGIALYVAARRYETEEETELADTFDGAWEDYRTGVLLPGV
jgi:protein-S-isoprenylcysteine O-methyltransferase Ste14